MDDLSGTVIEQRIEDVLSLGASATQSYKPRNGGMNKNLGNYTKEQIEHVYEKSEKLLHFFGYVKNPAHPDNNTPFYDYQNRASKESVG